MCEPIYVDHVFSAGARLDHAHGFAAERVRLRVDTVEVLDLRGRGCFGPWKVADIGVGQVHRIAVEYVVEVGIDVGGCAARLGGAHCFFSVARVRCRMWRPAGQSKIFSNPRG